MSGGEETVRERFERLAAAAVDGELDDASWRELEGILRERPELRAEMEAQRKVKEVLGTMRFAQPSEEVWDRYRVTVLHRLEQGVGWTLFTIGAALLLGYGAYQGVAALLDAGVSPWLKSGILATFLGLAVILGSLVRERLFLRKRERYDEVQR